MPNIDTKKEQAKTDFINAFSQLPIVDPDSIATVFIYVRQLDLLLEDLYNTGFNDGFKKATDMDVKS